MSGFDASQRRGFPTRPPRDDTSIPRSDLSIPQDLHSAQISINQRASGFPGQSAVFNASQGLAPASTQPQGFGPDFTSPQSLQSNLPPPGTMTQSQFPQASFAGFQPAPFNQSFQAVPPDMTPVHESVERTQAAVLFLSMIDVTVMVLLAEFACLYRNVCHVGSGVDVSPYASHAFVPICAICFAQVVCACQSASFVIRSAVRCLRISMLVFAVVIILFSIAEIIAMLASVNESERSSTWNAMSRLSQDFYDSSISKYVEQYKANIAMLAVFQIIVAAIMLGIAVAMFVLAGKTTDSYIPRFSYEKRKRLLKPPTETEMQNLSVSKDQGQLPPPPPPLPLPETFQLTEEPNPHPFPARPDVPFIPPAHSLAP